MVGVTVFRAEYCSMDKLARLNKANSRDIYCTQYMSL